MVRLFVGGLDDGVTEALLSSRFTSFGQVTACDVILRKDGDPRYQLESRVPAGAGQPNTPRAADTGPEASGKPSAEKVPPAENRGCRGFAYVDLEPKDEAALHRCLSLVSKSHLHALTCLRSTKSIPIVLPSCTQTCFAVRFPSTVIKYLHCVF